jgi:quercetin dioxygenase-like cupin family protein
MEAGDIFKATGANTDGRFELMVLDVGYLFGPPLHIHEVQEDSFYVLDGLVTVQVGDEVIKLQPGDFATAPPGVPHTFTNADPDRTARMVNIMTPGIGFDRYIAAAMSGSDEAEMKRLGKEFGVTMVGPPLPTRLGLG